MKMVSIQYAGIEKQLLAIFRRILFDPIIAVVKEASAQGDPLREHHNAIMSPLEQALHSGQVQYKAGIFSGKFSAAIARVIRSLGGKFDAKSKLYRIKPELVPNWVLSAAVV